MEKLFDTEAVGIRHDRIYSGNFVCIAWTKQKKALGSPQVFDEEISYNFLNTVYSI